MDLAALTDPETVPVERIPAMLGQLEAARAMLQARYLRASLVTQPAAVADPDVYLGIEDAARLVHRSRSWMEKHGATLPGFHQPRGKGTRAEWSRRALLAWGRAA